MFLDIQETNLILDYTSRSLILSILLVFYDSNWVSNLDDCRSTTGFCIYFGGNLFGKSFKKHNTILCSSTEEEFKDLANLTIEITWITSLLSELQVPFLKFQPYGIIIRALFNYLGTLCFMLALSTLTLISTLSEKRFSKRYLSSNTYQLLIN